MNNEYLRAEMNYHYLGNQFISFIWKEDVASGDDITCAQVQPEESRLPVESQPINEALLSANDAEVGAVGGSSSKSQRNSATKWSSTKCVSWTQYFLCVQWQM